MPSKITIEFGIIGKEAIDKAKAGSIKIAESFIENSGVYHQSNIQKVYTPVQLLADFIEEATLQADRDSVKSEPSATQRFQQALENFLDKTPQYMMKHPSIPRILSTVVTSIIKGELENNDDYTNPFVASLKSLAYPI